MRITFQFRWKSNAEKADGVAWPGRWQHGPVQAMLVWSRMGASGVFWPGQCRQRSDPRPRSNVQCVRFGLAVAA
jgi:hypothetical protein